MMSTAGKRRTTTDRGRDFMTGNQISSLLEWREGPDPLSSCICAITVSLFSLLLCFLASVYVSLPLHSYPFEVLSLLNGKLQRRKLWNESSIGSLIFAQLDVSLCCKSWKSKHSFSAPKKKNERENWVSSWCIDVYIPIKWLFRNWLKSQKPRLICYKT